MKRRAVLYLALVLIVIALVLAGVFLAVLIRKTSEPEAQLRISALPLKTAALTQLPTAVPEPAAAVVQTPEAAKESTPAPTEAPTPVPTAEPTPVPTEEPTPVPTAEPTLAPTVLPTLEPTFEPTLAPTPEVTPIPTITPVPTVLVTPVPTPAQVQAGEDAQAVLDLVNAQRTSAGLAPLTLSADLCGFAQVRAQEITVSFSHTRPDGTMPTSLSPLIFGENIAMGTNMSAQMAMQLWMDSQGHRDNILRGEFKTLGVGCVQSGDLIYWVQLFGY